SSIVSRRPATVAPTRRGGRAWKPLPAVPIDWDKPPPGDRTGRGAAPTAGRGGGAACARAFLLRVSSPGPARQLAAPCLIHPWRPGLLIIARRYRSSHPLRLNRRRLIASQFPARGAESCSSSPP